MGSMAAVETLAASTSERIEEMQPGNDWLLGSRVALQCARRVHNDFDPTLCAEQLREISTTQWAERGMEFEDRVVGLIHALHPDDVVDLRDAGHEMAVHLTQQALADGVAIIIGGSLPPDSHHHRAGRPDLLIRASPRSDGRNGYVPVEIKSHRITKSSRSGGVQTTTLENLGEGIDRDARRDLVPASTNLQRDLIQLAHYWRMLESCDHQALGVPTAGIIGSDTCTATEGFILWHSLTEPLFTTYSRTHGLAERSALERYDHEFDFRVYVVEVARQQGEPDAPAPVVRPILIEECDSCPWFDVCDVEMNQDDPSRHVLSGRLSVREWNALRSIGIETVTDLSELGMDDSRLSGYWTELDISEGRARSRLEAAIVRAQMSLAGEQVRWLNNPVEPIPRADVEVDFDLEWDDENRIYLWGFLVTEDGVSRSESVYSWEPLDDVGAGDLAVAALDRLMRLKSAAERDGKSFLVYHYSHPEVSMVRTLLASDHDGLPTQDWWHGFTAECFVDLLPIVRKRLFGLRGLGLKRVAGAAGFTWTEEEPSGEQTLEWIHQARSHPDESTRQDARDRLLRYNADDVRATLEVRRWLAAHQHV